MTLTPAAAQVMTPKHWEGLQTLKIVAPHDAIFVIEFLFLHANGYSNYEIGLPNGAGGMLKLEPHEHSNFDLAKPVKFVLLPGETLTIAPFEALPFVQGKVYASGYSQKVEP
jgi:hypothetical protein